MDGIEQIRSLLESDLRWCLIHKDDLDDDGDKFNRGYCSGRIGLIKDLLSELTVIKMQEEINHESN